MRTEEERVRLLDMDFGDPSGLEPLSDVGIEASDVNGQKKSIGKSGKLEVVPDWLAEKVAEAKRQAEMFLPQWDKFHRALPNEILRSSLFNARNRNITRENLKDFVINVVGGGRIVYSGEELRQDDELVWLQLIHMARERAIGEMVEFTPYSFCKAIKWPIKGESYVRLRHTLIRLQMTSLGVYSKRLGRGARLSMVPFFEWQDENEKSLNRYRVRVAPELVTIFGGVHFTRVEWEQRLRLPVGIATKLHGYFATHRHPFPVKVDTLMELCGLDSDRRRFKYNVKKALDSLVQVDFLKSWEIRDEGLVVVVRQHR